LRGEYTKRAIQPGADREFVFDRWDLFPTAHLSYRFFSGTQMMASYTRRIDRPGGRELEPFETWVDANNVWRGNPLLLPEYIDAYEVGAQVLLGQVSLSLEAYHRVEHNAIEDVRSVYSQSVTLTTPENVGREYSTGVEFLSSVDAGKIWNVNLIGNAYEYRIKGTIFNEPFARRSLNGRIRFNNMISIGSSTQVQVNAMWNSPSVSSQGRSEGFVSVDLAARQELFSKQLSATLQVQNLLGTARHEFRSEGPGFSSYSYRKMKSPVVMLTLRFTVNDYEPEREGELDNGGGGEEEF
jgi:outer membrane receptor protein involved in Fe transport